MRRRAMVLLLVAMALILIAATIKSGWLYLVASVLISLVVLGLYSGWRVKRTVSVERECPTRVSEGERFPVRMVVANGGRTARYLLSVKDVTFAPQHGLFAEMHRRRAEFREYVRTGKAPVPGQRGERGARIVAIERLGPGESLEVEYEMDAPRRGVYERALLEVEGGGVFGSAAVSLKLEPACPLTVLPRVFPVRAFPFDPRETVAPQESFEWARKGLGQDYFGVREYTQGDPLRHVHWKSSARHGRLIVREYQQELRPSAGILLVLVEPRYGGAEENSLEDGLRAAASLVNHYEKVGSAPRLVLPRGGSFELALHEAPGECLTELAAYVAPARDLEQDLLVEGLAYAGYALAGVTVSVVTNVSGEAVSSAARWLPDAVGSSLVLVDDGSYARRPGEGGGGVPRAILGRQLSVFTIARGEDIGECLSGRSNTIAS